MHPGERGRGQAKFVNPIERWARYRVQVATYPGDPLFKAVSTITAWKLLGNAARLQDGPSNLGSRNLSTKLLIPAGARD